MNHPAPITRFLLTAASIIIVVASCTPYRVEYMEESLRHMNQAELVHKFGYPQRLKRVTNGDQVWQYEFQGKESECALYVITFDPHEELRSWDRRDCTPAPDEKQTGK